MTTRSVVGGTGFVLVGVGLLVMVGWFLQTVLLVQLRADWAPMQFNAALCFALFGAGLLCAMRGLRGVQCVIGALVAVFAFAVLFQYLFSVNLQIDQLFVKNWVYEPYVHPGRIPATVATLLMVAGIALAHGDRFVGFAFAAGVVIGVNGLLFVVAYLPGFEHIAAWSGFAKVALHTAVGLVVAGVGLVATAFYHGAKAPQGKAPAAPLTRERMVPAFLFLVLAVTGVNLWQVLVHVELARVGDDTAEAAEALARQLSATQADRVSTLRRMAHRVERDPGWVASGDWQLDAEEYLRDISGVLAIGLHGESGPLVPPVTGRIGLVIEPPATVLDRALRTGSVISTPSLIIVPLALPEGRPPMALIARIGYGELLRTVIGDMLPGYAVTVSIDGEILYERYPGRSPPRGTPIASFAVPGGFTDARWSARVWRETRAADGHRGPLPLAVLILSLLAATLAGVVSRTSRRLRAQREIDAGVWRESGDVLCLIDKADRFVRVSESSYRVWGYRAEDLVGTDYQAIVAPEALDATAAEVEALESKKYVTGFRNFVCRPDGTRVPMSWTSVWAEELGLLICIGRDVTAQVEHEAELERRVAERTHDLTLANAELETFSYSVSHDLRTPLRAIAGFTGILKEELPAEVLSESAQHSLNRVLEGTDRMARLIDDLLRLGQLSRRDVDKRPVDLSALAEEVVARLRAAEPAKNVEFHIQPGLMALADVSLIELVLDNLFGNAWKFTKDAIPAVIEFTEQGGVFSVADNGVGFDMEYAGSLFGVFQRLHGVHEYAGTGIGLATVKRIIERHGGEVWANAEVGKGATFNFTLG